MSSDSLLHSNCEAVVAPSDKQNGKDGLGYDAPYARIELSLFHREADAKRDDQEGDKALDKELGGLCHEIKRVVLLNRHSGFHEFLLMAYDFIVIPASVLGGAIAGCIGTYAYLAKHLS